jgi:NTE family protein
MLEVERMARIGLVLGAGGIVGQAHHAGVLAALEEELGWDARTADVIVGSSAGSVTGALLRLGASAGDMAAYVSDLPLSVEGTGLFESLGPRELDLPPFALGDLLRRRWRPPSARLVRRALLRPWALRPAVAAVAMMPAGEVDLSEHTAVLDAVPAVPDGDDVGGGGWPHGLFVCAARRDDGRRVAFGREGSPEAPLSQAVAASCAIPGYFAPVRIDGEEYVDGAVHSPTNADVVVSSELDLVVVVSPMSAAHGRSTTPDAAMRFAAHRRLCREAGRLRKAGSQVIVFEPEHGSLGAMGFNAMAEDRSAEVVDAARRETAVRLVDPRLASRLELHRSGGMSSSAAA